MRPFLIVVLVLTLGAPLPRLHGAEPELIGRWLLPGNAEESEGQRPASVRDSHVSKHVRFQGRLPGLV